MDRQHRDEFDVELKSASIGGIAANEVRAAREALAELDDHTATYQHLLRSDWLSVVTERESRELERLMADGKAVPAKRESLVEKAIRERPMALAKARQLKAAVYAADNAAVRAFRDAAPDALPGMREAASEALSDAQRALSEFTAAVRRANSLHLTANEVAIMVRRPLPTQAEYMRRMLLDTVANVSELERTLDQAKRRAGNGA